MAGGRPTIYTLELAHSICYEISTSSKSLQTICNQLDVSLRAVMNWLGENKEFMQLYAKAKENQADWLAEEMLEIADDGTNDYMTIVKGDMEYNVENREVTNRSRLRVDTRKWIASKLKPRKYSEKLDVTSAGEKLQSGTIINLPTDKLKQLEQLLADGFTTTDNPTNITGSPEGAV